MKFECYRNNRVFSDEVSPPLILEDKVAIGRGDEVLGGLALFDGRLYKPTSQYLACMDAIEKRLIWKRPLKEECGLPVDGEDGRVYLSIDRQPVCLDAENGKTIWEATGMNGEILGASFDNLYFAERRDTETGSVIACSKESCEELWRLERPHGIPMGVAMEGRLLLVEGSRGFHVFEESTGTLLWQARYGEWLAEHLPGKSFVEMTALGPEVSTCIGPLAEGVLYLGCRGGEASDSAGHLMAIDAKCGALLWTYEIEGEKVKPARRMLYHHGKLYFILDRGWGTRNYLTCLDAATGERLFRTEEDFNEFGWKNPILSGKFFLGGAGNYLRFFDIERQEFVYLYKYEKRINMFGGYYTFVHNGRLITHNNALKQIYWFGTQANP